MRMGGFFIPMKQILRDQRLWLLAGWGIVVFVVARLLVSPALAINLVVKGGYWLVLANFVFFAAVVWRLVRDHWKACSWGKTEWAAAALILAVTVMWQSHESRGFKILADEVLLLGTSMDMHLEREATYPIRATDVQGPFQILQGVLDKRPLFFPFVVSLVHDLTGYRASNSFYMNMALGVIFLGLVYGLARRIGGNPWAGVLGVMLFAGLPLMSQQAAGGGFELLNLVMIATVIWLACRFAEKPDEDTTAALCLSTALLAQTRYESALFIVPVAALIVWSWVRSGNVILPRSIWLLPVFLMPYVLQNRQFESDASLWELAGQGSGATTPFALEYLPDNLGHALEFFFDTSGFQPNSIYFAALGLLALPLFGIWITRVLRNPKQVAPTDIVIATMGLGLFGLTGLVLIYFWGQFDHPVIHRLSLPLHFVMMLAIIVVLARWVKWPQKWKALCALSLIALLARGVPAMAKRAYEMDYLPAREMAWRQEFLERFPERDYLFIDQDSVFWITNRVTATPIKQAQIRKEGLMYHLKNHSFSAMYVFQRFKVDDQTGELVLEPADELGADFELEPVWEKRVATLVFGRISRVKAIRDETQSIEASEYASPAKGEQRTSEQLEKAKAQYFENWIEQLP